MNTVLKSIGVNTCRLLVSAVFVFSGIVKLIDPHGTEYRLADYASALGLSSLSVEPVPLVLAVALAMTEFCFGIYLLYGIRRRLTTRLILILLLVFTPLTLWLAVTDAVEDCGCFGDAVHLTNWQTFAKNVVLLAMAVLLCRTRRYQMRLLSEAVHWVASLFTIIYGILVALLALWQEPMLDFRPYYIGQDMAQAMQWPDDPMLRPEILDFTIEPIEGLEDGAPPTPDIDEILADTGYTFLLIAPYLDRADDANVDDINSIADFARSNDYRFLCLTASSAPIVRRWQELTGAEYDFAFVDELTLKTVMRSNPGLLLLHGSQIVDKYGNAGLSQFFDAGQEPFHQRYAVIEPHDERESRHATTLLLYYVLPLCALMLIDRLVAAVRWWLRRRRASRQ